MHFLRNALLVVLVVLAASGSCTALAIPSTSPDSLSHFSEPILLPGRAIPEPPHVNESREHLEKRQLQALLRFAKTWFKVGKAIFKDYRKIAEENDKDGAGFHRDFGDLVDAQLPAPSKSPDQLDDLMPGDA